jgi:hypothetical protein
MRCSDINELLSAYAEGELPLTQQEFVEEHLSSCADCRATLADYQRVKNQLSTLRAMPVISSIREAVISQITAPKIPGKHLQRWLRPALVAVPLAAVLTPLLILQPWSGPDLLGVIDLSAIEKAYAALEELKAYRMDYSDTYTLNTLTNKTYKIEAESGKAFHETEDRPYYAYSKEVLYDETLSERIRSETIRVGDNHYAYGESSSGALLTMVPTTDILSGNLVADSDMEILPDEMLRGVDCWHYRITANMEKLVLRMKSSDSLTPEKEKKMLQGEFVMGLWIGKEDNIIRREKVYSRFPSLVGDGWHISDWVKEYYDINVRFTLEPPVNEYGELLPGWRVQAGSLVWLRGETEYSISGDDPAHQQVKFTVKVTNYRGGWARNVRVQVSTMLVNAESKPATIEAKPVNPGPVELYVGDSETFEVDWEYDASAISAEELEELLRSSIVIIEYPISDGKYRVETRYQTNGMFLSPPEKYPVDSSD